MNKLAKFAIATVPALALAAVNVPMVVAQIKWR